MSDKPKPIYFISDHHGVYIPKMFAEFFDTSSYKLEGVGEEELKILKAGPEEEDYWDVWESVERCGIVIDDKQIRNRVHMDGDCWLIPEGMEWDHNTCTWFYPGEASHGA
jgi:hypothetical protein